MRYVISCINTFLNFMGAMAVPLSPASLAGGARAPLAAAGGSGAPARGHHARGLLRDLVSVCISTCIGTLKEADCDNLRSAFFSNWPGYLFE